MTRTRTARRRMMVAALSRGRIQVPESQSTEEFVRQQSGALFLQLLFSSPSQIKLQLDSLSNAELTALEAFAGKLDLDDGIDWVNVPEIVFDAAFDGEVTVEELRERYPSRMVVEGEEP